MQKKPREIRMQFTFIWVICGLFNDTVRNSHYIASNNKTFNNELERMWKEAVVA
jgi:hypothetical protein